MMDPGLSRFGCIHTSAGCHTRRGDIHIRRWQNGDDDVAARHSLQPASLRGMAAIPTTSGIDAMGRQRSVLNRDDRQCRVCGMRNSVSKKPAAKKHRVYTISFASVYPLYVAKAEKKGRTKAEVDEVISWLTGYRQKALDAVIEKKTDLETFFAEAPRINPSRALITGVVCGIRVEDIKEPLMREIRYMDKLIDELAKGKAMDKILRKK
jgi:hypothetical protein